MRWRMPCPCTEGEARTAIDELRKARQRGRDDARRRPRPGGDGLADATGKPSRGGGVGPWRPAEAFSRRPELLDPDHLSIHQSWPNHMRRPRAIRRSSEAMIREPGRAA